MYLIYDVEDKSPYIKEIGSWNGIMVGEIHDSLITYSVLPNAVYLTKDVAMAYKFVAKYKGYINVRPNTEVYDQINKDLLVPYKDKFQYFLTEEDKANACLFQKCVMYFMLNKHYNNKINISNNTPSWLRDNNWSSEHVLLQKKKFVEQEIDSCQDWVETGILMDKRFGVQHDPNIAAQPIDL